MVGLGFLRRCGKVPPVRTLGKDEDVWESQGVRPPFLTSALDRGGWLASCSCRFISEETAPFTHFIGGWVGPQSRSGPSLYRLAWPKHFCFPIVCYLLLHSLVYHFHVRAGARGSAVAWDTMLESGTLRVLFSVRPLDFSSWPNHSSRIVALGSTQPLTEMSTRNLPGGNGRPARKADILTAISEPIV
jgi:hypothetical protein